MIEAPPALPWRPRFDGSARMAVLYALIFSCTGAGLPYITPWFAAHGLSGSEIGVVLGAPMIARLFSSPLIAVWADSFRLRRTPIAILGTIAAVGFATLALGRGFATWLPIWFVAATAMAAIIPLSDVLTLRRARREGFAFGWPRGVGSLAFVAATVAMGAILARASIDAVVVWMTVSIGVLALAAVTLGPDEPVNETGPVSRAERFRGLGRLVGDPVFMIAIAAVGLIQATHAFYYGFSTISWKAQGISEQTSGLLWGFGVVAEIVFLWFLEPWRRRLGPWTLLLLAGLAALVRWTAMAYAPPLLLLWPLQVLHALSFAASFVAGLVLVERLSPPENVSAAQTLSSALSSGVMIGPATMLSGPLYDRYGAQGYLAMSVLALAGVAATLWLRPQLEAREAEGA